MRPAILFALPPLAQPGNEAFRAAIARCAFLAWQAEGCQPGRDVEYWIEAEIQLEAAWQVEAEAVVARQPAPRTRACVSSEPRSAARRQTKPARALVLCP